MLQALYDYFYNLFVGDGTGYVAEVLETLETSMDYGQGKLIFSEYLSMTCAFISFAFILVACVMFVVKMIKLVGNLVK